LACAVLYAASSFAETKSKSAKEAAAERLARKGRAEEAVKIYKELLNEDQGNAAIVSALAELQAKLGRYNEAAALYAALFTKKVRKLRAQRQRGLSDEALHIYHKIDTMPHGNPRASVEVADALMSAGKVDWARKELEKALSIDPGYADAYFYLGKNYQMKGDLRAAAGALEKAVELNPSNYYARNNLGGLYMQMDRLDQATGQFTAAVEVKKDNALSHYNLAVVSVIKGRYPQAVKHLQDALTYAPADMNARGLLAIVYFEKLQDYRSALRVYERILSDKTDITGREALAIQERIARCKEEIKKGGTSKSRNPDMGNRR
jgi:tetratricopeptide (TPR) repeat protein